MQEWLDPVLYAHHADIIPGKCNIHKPFTVSPEISRTVSHIERMHNQINSKGSFHFEDTTENTTMRAPTFGAKMSKFLNSQFLFPAFTNLSLTSIEKSFAPQQKSATFTCKGTMLEPFVA